MFRPALRQTVQHSRGFIRTGPGAHRYAHAPAAFDWKDPLTSNNLFTEEELAISETAESYCQERLLPRVLGSHRSSADAFHKLMPVRYRCLPK